MAANPLADTRKRLEEATSRSSSVLVAFSGGKDSLAVLDLCLRAFRRVECFHMEFLPGLQCVETELARAEQRFGVRIHRAPHWVAAKNLRAGIYGWQSWRNDDLPEWKLRDIYDLVVAETKIPLIAHGGKKSDSMWRRRQMGTWAWADVIYPLAEWTKLDVLAFLKSRGIRPPDSSGKQATGIDLSTPSLLWLHDNHPLDFERVCKVFPFAGAVVARRAFFGVSA